MNHSTQSRSKVISFAFVALAWTLGTISEKFLQFTFRTLGVKASAPLNVSIWLVCFIIGAVAIATLQIYFERKYRLGRAPKDGEDDHHSLFEHNVYAVFTTDLTGRLVQVNPTFERLTKYSKEDLDQLPPFSLVIPSQKHKVRACLQQVFQGIPQQIQVVIYTKDGEPLDADISYIPKYRGREITGAYAIGRDISAHRQAERAHQDLREMVTSFINSTSDALLIFQTDQTVLHVNRAFERIYGWTSEELIGQTLPPIIPAYLSHEAEHMIATVLIGEVVSSAETVRLRKDGTSLDVNVTVAPIRNADGEVIAIAGMSRDITKHKEMARELSETQHRLRSMITHTADSISLIDMEGRLLMVNPAWEKICGWTADEVIGQLAPAALERPEEYAEFIRYHSQGNVSKREGVLKRKDGSLIEVSMTGSPVFSSEGKVVSIAVIAKDLTEMRKTEEVILRADKLALTGELAAGIAHEIRNPLTAIQGYLQLMRTHFDPKYLPILLSEVKRINDITEEFLLLSKPQIEVQEFADMKVILNDVLKLMESAAHMHSIEINTAVPDDLPAVWCVKNQLKQVLMNLMKNSIEAMPKGGKIQIVITHGPTGFQIIVEDNGPGIAPERIAKLGEPFYTTKDRGTGLGLMVTYRIIHKHGGIIQASSVLGEGTKFEMFLPATEAHL